MENLHIFRGGIDMRLLGLLIDKGHARPGHRQQDDDKIGARKRTGEGKRNMEKKPRWMAVIFFSRWVQEPVIWQRATSVTTERRARRKDEKHHDQAMGTVHDKGIENEQAHVERQRQDKQNAHGSLGGTFQIGDGVAGGHLRKDHPKIAAI